MGWKKLLAGGFLGGVSLFAVGVVLVVLVVLVATVGGFWWLFLDDNPQLYYDARPAEVNDARLSGSGYERVGNTAFNVSVTPIPRSVKGVHLRTWATLYAKGPALSSEDPGGEQGPDQSVDPADGSVVAVFSTSALQVGPVAFNPLVYASDPGLLDDSGVLIEKLEDYLPANVSEVTDVDVESSRDVEMLGQETQMTTFSGTLVLEEGSEIRVRMYLARAVEDGELVIAMGIAPADGRSADEFAGLVRAIEMGDWDAEPDWKPPDPEEGPAGPGDSPSGDSPDRSFAASSVSRGALA